MSEFLKGNFNVKRPVKENESSQNKVSDQEKFKEEYRRKALGSIGGSMVFVEMDQLSWDGDTETASKEKEKK